MSYVPLDSSFVVADNPLAAELARKAVANAQWLYDNRLHAWSLYWPAGVYASLVPDADEAAEWEEIAGMVYTAEHGTTSLDYSGLYVSTCPGEPLAFPVPVPLSGRARAVRVYATVVIEDGGASAGTVTMWPQLVIDGAEYPRAFDPAADLTRAAVAYPQIANCVYPGAQAVDTGDNGAGGWTVLTWRIEWPDDGVDRLPADDRPRGMPQLLFCVLSTPSVAEDKIVATRNNYGSTHDVVSPGVQVRLIGAPNGVQRGPKPHQVYRTRRVLEAGADDAEVYTLHHALCVRRYDQNENDLAAFVWPPVRAVQNGEGPDDASTITVYDLPAVRILAIRIEEEQ